jgi:hypothetical protein
MQLAAQTSANPPRTMRGLLGSLRYTVRLLLKSPGFTIIAVLILGFGIGVNTAIFSLINAVILKPLPYPNPDRLVRVCQPYQDNLSMGFDYPDFVDMVATQHSFELLAVADREVIDLSGNGQPEHLEVDFVSPSMFKVSGLPTVAGTSSKLHPQPAGGMGLLNNPTNTRKCSAFAQNEL